MTLDPTTSVDVLRAFDACLNDLKIPLISSHLESIKILTQAFESSSIARWRFIIVTSKLVFDQMYVPSIYSYVYSKQDIHLEEFLKTIEKTEDKSARNKLMKQIPKIVKAYDLEYKTLLQQFLDQTGLQALIKEMEEEDDLRRVGTYKAGWRPKDV